MGNSTIRVRQLAGGIFQLAGHPFARNLPLLAIGCWFAWLLVGRLQAYDLQLLAQLVAEIAVWQWALAIAATAISFSAVAGYDIVASRAMATPIPPKDALLVGFTATALAQLIGLGLAVVRWRGGVCWDQPISRCGRPVF